MGRAQRTHWRSYGLGLDRQSLPAAAAGEGAMGIRHWAHLCANDEEMLTGGISAYARGSGAGSRGDSPGLHAGRLKSTWLVRLQIDEAFAGMKQLLAIADAEIANSGVDGSWCVW